MDWPTFIGVVVVLLFAVIPMMAFPKASEGNNHHRHQ